MVATPAGIDQRAEAQPGGDRADHRAYVPGLDGLRAVAVLVVLGYHHSPTAVPGGFLGVSTFFVLSGYLIGSLCFAEVARTGTIRAGRFWERRVRRLMPAALVTLLAVVAMGRIWGITGGPGQRADLLAALTWCANWRFLAEGSGYQTAFADPSPVQHFWSLAIEEQFYVLFPLLVLGLVWATRRRWPAIRLLVAGSAVATTALAAWVAEAKGFEQAYYATYTRAGELLIGVSLAAALAGGSALLERLRPRRAPVQVAATAGLVGLVVLALQVDLSSPRLFSGIIVLNAACTVVVIVGCLLGGPAAAGLAVWPIRALGRISYGVYLFHWPLYLLLDENRTGLDGPALFLLRFCVTIAAAVVSYHLIESPIRFRQIVPSRLVATSAIAALVVTALAIVALPPQLTDAQRQTAAIELPEGGLGGGSGRARMTDSARLRPTKEVVERTAGTEPVARLLVVGDSLAFTMIPGLDAWNAAHPDQQLAVDGYTEMGCPVSGGTGHVELAGRSGVVWPSCQLMVEAMSRHAPLGHYDAVLVAIGLADLGNREIGDEEGWAHIGQAAFDRRLTARIDGLAGAFGDTPVFWATYPEIRMEAIPGKTGSGPFDENEPARLRALNEMIRATLADHQRVTLVDLHGWCDRLPEGCLNRDLRPDGVHFSARGAAKADAWIVPQILRRITAGPAN